LGGAETPIDNRSRDKIDMKVWVDQDLCTGDGLCAEIAPDNFEMHDDGLAYVKEVGWPTMYGPDGAAKGEPVYKILASVSTTRTPRAVAGADSHSAEGNTFDHPIRRTRPLIGGHDRL